ncbi:CTP:phosphoglutamine cytidylyltransferase [Candidatus Entotheonellaceae bacterium PAL068K]
MKDMITSSRQAIILAAGQGCRLWPYTKDLPKCLLRVGGQTILERQVAALHTQNVDHITVVTGYMGHKVREVLGTQVAYVDNPHFARTSSMYSLWLARAAATDGCIILNADVLFHQGILQALQTSPHADALAVDFDAVLVEEETKVVVDGERVCALGKTLPRGDAENVGMIKLSARGSRVLFATIEELLAHHYRQVMVPYAVDIMAATYFLAAVAVDGLPWIEIDFPSDYQWACEVIYPAIRKDRQACLALSPLSSQHLDEGS